MAQLFLTFADSLIKIESITAVIYGKKEKTIFGDLIENRVIIHFGDNNALVEYFNNEKEALERIVQIRNIITN